MLISQKDKNIWELRCDGCQKVFEKTTYLSKIERSKEHSCSKECHSVVMYKHTYRGGKVKSNRTETSSIYVGDGTVKIPLSQGLYAIVSEEDWPKVKDYTWSATNHLHTYYASTSVIDGNGKKCRIYMHRLILETPNLVDHIDRNGLNNKKDNLREATKSENARNAKVRSDSISKNRGVSWIPEIEKWRALIKVDGQPKYLGNFLTKEEAIEARKKAEVEIDAEFYGHNQ